MKPPVPILIGLMIIAATVAGCAQAPANGTADGGNNPSQPRIPSYSPAARPVASPTPKLTAPIAMIQGPILASSNDTTLVISWTVSVSGDLQAGQTVQSHVRLTGKGKNIDTPDQAGLGERDAVIGGLKPNTTYSVSIVAAITGQPGVAMGAQQFTTALNRFALPPPAPGNVTAIQNVLVDNISDGAADVHWYIKGNGTVESWAEWGEKFFDKRSPSVRGIGGLSTAIGPLEPNHNYLVRVVARAGSTSMNTTPILFHTPHRPVTGTPIGSTPTPGPTSGSTGGNTPSAPVITVTGVQVMDPHRIRINYDVSGSGAITSFIEYESEAAFVGSGGTYGQQSVVIPSAGAPPVGAGSRQNELEFLSDDTDYHFRIVASNSVGTSRTSDYIRRTIDEVRVNIGNPGTGNWACGTPGTLSANYLNTVEFNISNTHVRSHEWILTDPFSVPGKTPVVYTSTKGGYLPEVQGANVASETIRGVTFPATTAVYRMYVNKGMGGPPSNPPAGPFWTTGEAPFIAYEKTGYPGTFTPPYTPSGPSDPRNYPAASDMCGQLQVGTPFRVTTTSVTGGPFPPQSACDAGGSSLQLDIRGVPATAQTLAFVAEDIDNGNVHWVWWDLTADPTVELTTIPLGQSIAGLGGVEGTVTGGLASYTAPCLPPGTSDRIFLRMYALTGYTNLPSTATKANLNTWLGANAAAVVGKSELFLRYPSGGTSPSGIAPTISAFSSTTITSTSIAVQFTVAGSNPITTQVDYGTTTSYGSSTTPATASAGTRTATITGLTPSTTYNLRVAASNGVGSVQSTNLVVTTAPPPFTVTSSSFADGGTIPLPQVHGMCSGGNVSPQLSFTNIPAGTTSIALSILDLDAGNFVHWTFWDLPSTTTNIPAGQVMSALGAKEGQNDFPATGYGGPCPPPGPQHRYQVTAYALSASLGLAPGASGAAFSGALSGKVIQSDTYLGLYS